MHVCVSVWELGSAPHTSAPGAVGDKDCPPLSEEGAGPGCWDARHWHTPLLFCAPLCLLSRRSILANDFRVYTYTHSGSVVSTTPSIQRDCYYQGYVETYTNSLVTLSTCTGLSGVLLFENLTYGIEPVTSTSGFQHLVYQIEYSSRDLSVSKENYSIKWSAGMNQRYDFMGSNEDVLMFFKLNLRIILSSLELWIDRDKISTLGTAEELLEKFVEWKQTHLALRPHDVSFLFGDMCPALYQDGILLETFSVIVAQLLGISLGLHFDNSRECFCPVSTCVMNTKAVQSNGAKFFSSCSVKDFRNFLGFGSSQCLLNRPRIDITYRSPSCGNRVLEEGEQCDCGSAKQCESSPCCQSDCTLKSGKECAQGPCCVQCKVSGCRPPAHTVDEDCDLKEYCNGTSAECTEDFFVQDGQTCEADTGVCMKGICQSPDRWCRKIFGKDSRSGSLQCYEEINSQNDRMGHCGSTARGYQNCQWQDLKCGKLVCEYPSKKPFVVDNTAIIYAKVQNRLCVTLDYMKGPGVKDPFLVQDGTGCGKGMVRAALGAMEDPGQGVGSGAGILCGWRTRPCPVVSCPASLKSRRQAPFRIRPALLGAGQCQACPQGFSWLQVGRSSLSQPPAFQTRSDGSTQNAQSTALLDGDCGSCCPDASEGHQGWDRPSTIRSYLELAKVLLCRLQQQRRLGLAWLDLDVILKLLFLATSYGLFIK
uniref:Uncharacterized protein n=1 Tax=Varanus komodoensis TaxID=61221 RepID=A0A8D2LLH2_VARKO